ncbi:hypothetical protein KIL84_011903 [Mauremys mutica]|uniref:FAM171 N-terminal domain-containing protein n=1 Tax=Mauremys mutica TaxID=74926 RepID=A0A9D4B2Q7_9SAUR|nr:hypothetical protein KIL84_011903 [Mauremys mutica]
MSRSAALLLCLLGCNVWKAVTKTLGAPGAAREVTLKVHVSDASTHQPVTEAFIEIFTNQISIASGTSGADGTAFIKFQYKLGNQLIVTATKHAYVPNSAPWKPTRLPVFSSLSLGLLPERSATLMVYDDVVQIVSGFQGARIQPRVHFQRRTLKLPENTSYSDLTAFLTAASSPWEVDSFPYLQGLDGNGTGNSTRYDLTPVTAVSVHLLNSDGTPIPVNGPIYVTVPLPTNSNLKHNGHVPAWRFDQKFGTWLKSSLGLVQQEGNQLTWTYIAPQLGYWVAAMSPTNPGSRGKAVLRHARHWTKTLQGLLHFSCVRLGHCGIGWSQEAMLSMACCSCSQMDFHRTNCLALLPAEPSVTLTTSFSDMA